MNCGGIKLVLLVKNSHLSEMMQSYKCYQHVSKIKGVAYVEATEAAASVKNICKKNIKTIKFYFHVLNKGTINKLTD